MIRLDFISKDKLIQQKEVSKYYERISSKCNKKRIEELNAWCDSNLDMATLFPKTNLQSSMKSFEQVVTADLETLLSIRDYISSSKSIVMQESLKKYLLNTVYKSNIERLLFVQSLGVTVCPYCNRNFINSMEDRTTCHFDHFINKSDFPILAVSFYNLVPVCSSCNHVKDKWDLSYSPYDDTVQTDEMVTFTFEIIGEKYLSDSRQLKLRLKPGSSNKLKDNLNILKLEDLYQIHTDSVQELLMKKEIYTEVYRNQLYRKFEGLLGSKEDFERLITGAYTDSESYGRRPLSKMITDISKELGLIKGE
ncbi:HNH endonuclease [Neobacillus drentensis]|uniref:HNH endonuclease n=1 Tax=Neobacillus drentensis TaxID=220684 RepID=UPI002FFE68B5